MSLFRKAAKRDASEPDIIQALKACGWSVLQVSVKDGPDLFAAKRMKQWVGVRGLTNRAHVDVGAPVETRQHEKKEH